MLNQIYVLSVLLCLSFTVSGCQASGEAACPPLDAEPPDPRAVRPVEVGLQSVCQLVSTRAVAAHF